MATTDIIDLFTPEFKRWKARNPPPDLKDAVDLHSCLKEDCGLYKNITRFTVRKTRLKPLLGLKPCESWEAFQFTHFPGFFLILNPFLNGFQMYWITRCLQDFPSNKQNITNLHALRESGGTDLWNDFVASKRGCLAKEDPLRRLRWTTLGYHYDWTAKEYSENNKGGFPVDLSCLSEYLASCLGFDNYRSEAAIINYYHQDSTLAGHTDHSELDQSAPLFSVSFGQAAIFLLGGPTKSVKPLPILLKSGDVCVMSGDSRLAYHAVPRILHPVYQDPFSNAFSYTNDMWDGDHKRLYSESKQHEQPLQELGTLQQDDKCVGNSYGLSTLHDEIVHGSSKKMKFVSQCTLETKFDLSEASDNPGTENAYNSHIDEVNDGISAAISTTNFEPFLIYLHNSRINMNIRQVLPPGIKTLPCIVSPSGEAEQSSS